MPDTHFPPAPGTHLVTLRCGYCHHGIYVGDGKVVHYAGFGGALQRGPVEEVALAGFTAGQPVWIDADPRPGYPGPEVVRRARSRLDENDYRLLSNNCEHFCTWCLSGESRSEQVRDWHCHPRAALCRAVRLFQAYREAYRAAYRGKRPPAGAGVRLLPARAATRQPGLHAATGEAFLNQTETVGVPS
ncbi:lecithin retinol acyltransferase family protein [Cupriavidus malaysiensis]|uniref:lecithin retinol acyltransferase family protein n=1 Tax=Cupriavidus malaysiensis TaxID=367825 RepID=UPI000A9DB6D3|nr:lecithin retinol acyltransferase family protein [Cupriavidus malaysiensis]